MFAWLLIPLSWLSKKAHKSHFFFFFFVIPNLDRIMETMCSETCFPDPTFCTNSSAFHPCATEEEHDQLSQFDSLPSVVSLNVTVVSDSCENYWYSSPITLTEFYITKSHHFYCFPFLLLAFQFPMKLAFCYTMLKPRPISCIHPT